MGWQLWVVIAIVALAAVYLTRITWRAWSASGKGCGGGCCGAKGPGNTAEQSLVSNDQLLARLRPPKGPHGAI